MKKIIGDMVSLTGKVKKVKMNVYHVHVYRVTAKAEFRTYSESARQAKEMALEVVKYSKDKFKKTYFLCHSNFKNNLERKDSSKRFEHQMFTICQFETTLIFLLVDIARCFFPRHGISRVCM